MDRLAAIRRGIEGLHAKPAGWVTLGCYIYKRGWYATAGSPRWVSPHDGQRYSLNDAALIELLRDFDS